MATTVRLLLIIILMQFVVDRKIAGGRKRGLQALKLSEALPTYSYPE